MCDDDTDYDALPTVKISTNTLDITNLNNINANNTNANENACYDDNHK